MQGEDQHADDQEDDDLVRQSEEQEEEIDLGSSQKEDFKLQFQPVADSGKHKKTRYEVSNEEEVDPNEIDLIANETIDEKNLMGEAEHNDEIVHVEEDQAELIDKVVESTGTPKEEVEESKEDPDEQVEIIKDAEEEEEEK